MDPYVRVQIGQKTFRTKTHNNGGKNPSWYDEFEYYRTTEDTLYAYVNDDDVGKDDLVGSGTLDLKPICSGMNFASYIKLFYHGKESGELYLEVMFYPGMTVASTSVAVGYVPQTGYAVAPQAAYMPAQPMSYPTYVPNYPGSAPGYPPMYAPTTAPPTYNPGYPPTYAPPAGPPAYPAPYQAPPGYMPGQPMQPGYGAPQYPPQYPPSGYPHY